MSDDLKRYKLVRGDPGYRDQMCVRPDGAWVRHDEAADRITELEAERDQAVAERDDNAAALREFIADRDRLEAEVARLREALGGGVRDRNPTQSDR